MNRIDAITLLKEIIERFNVAMTNFVSLDVDNSNLWRLTLNWVPDQDEKEKLEVFAKEHNVKVETENNTTRFSNLT